MSRTLRKSLVAGLGALWLSGAAAAPPVIINEIHYNPLEGGFLEFVELKNTTAEDIDIAGWSFVEGVSYLFPPETMIAAGGFLVVCANPEALSQTFDLPREALHVWVASALDNAGENLALADELGAIVERLDYDDAVPWDTAADGFGPSLQRLCADADASAPNNWSGKEGEPPTPLAPNSVAQCPPPPLPSPEIAINEIYYHPLNDKETEEFVELTNATDRAIDLKGYCFSRGIEFCFEETRMLEPGGFVVVCRDLEAAKSAFSLGEEAVGNYVGQLSNDGERLTLVDPLGNLVDSVRYGERGDWNIVPDGLGFSLEKMLPTAVSDDPASWSDSSDVQLQVNEWTSVSITGQATSDKLLFYLDGAGEVLLDDVSIVSTEETERNLIPNGTFDAGIDGWNVTGSHEGSRWSQAADGGAWFDRPALHLVATGRGSGTSNSVNVDTTEPLDRSTEKRYTLSFSYLLLSGSTGLASRLSLSTPSRGIYFNLGLRRAQTSPGKPNLSSRRALPPFVSDVTRYPQEPTSGDPVWIRARVRGDPTSVTLLAKLPGGDQEFTMRDDGLALDGEAGDGVYGVELPPQPHNTPVPFRIEAVSEAGRRTSPPEVDLTALPGYATGGPTPMEYHGYCVNDNRPDSKLPVYSLILPDTNARSYIAKLNCSTYGKCSFAYEGDLYYNVDIRQRGGSVCNNGTIPKKYFKIRFHTGQDFQKRHKINFQSLYTDKSLVREHLAWRLFGEMANPYCTHEFIRVHANGAYFGLYAELEHPDHRFLERNGLNPQGNLYKATASREEATGTYEEETNEDGDMSDLREFLTAMHATPSGQLVDFFHTRMDEDNVIDYQAAQVLTNNSDYPHKNHFLYHDTERQKWMVITWDMDLTFGKLWNGSYGGVLHDLMHNPGITPWYTTNVRGGGTGNHLLDKFFYQGGTWYRRAYLTRLWDALAEKYRSDLFEEKLTKLHDLLYEEQLEDIRAWGRSPATADDPRAPADFEPNLDRVREHIRVRRNYLINYLQGTEKFTGHDRLKITEIMYNPAGDDNAEFLELWNNTGAPIDISGWTIEGIGAPAIDGTPIEFTFPAGTGLDADEVIVVVKDPKIFGIRYDTDARVFGPYPGFLSNSGEEIRVKDAGPGYPATVDLVRYGTDLPWPRRADGLGNSLELFDVEPDLDNDEPRWWRDSEKLSGSPGRVHKLGEEESYARRGDCNGDGSLNVTDPIALILHLFVGGDEPPCLEACNADADDRTDLSDAVGILMYLFVADADPPPPALRPWECAAMPTASCAQSTCTP